MRPSLLIIALAAAQGADAARAGEAACRFEGGAVIVAAEMAGIAGDFVLDTGAPQSALHETKAQTEGIAATELTGDVRFAGLTTPAVALKVQDLDSRGWNLPTPLAGLIGADILKAYVVDVTFAPCRIVISRPGEAPRWRGRSVPLGWDLGRPTAEASVADEAHRITGAFVVATGANAPVRLADDLAAVPAAAASGPAAVAEFGANGVNLARLPQVTFAGRVGRDVAAGLMAPEGDVVGVLGAAVLANFRLRFDFPGGRLFAEPN